MCIKIFVSDPTLLSITFEKIEIPKNVKNEKGAVPNRTK